MLTHLLTFLRQLPDLWAATSPHCPYASSDGPDPSLPGGYKNSVHVRNTRLFDLDKLSIPASNHAIFTAVNEKVMAYMYQSHYDPSHDYEHVQRVVMLAKKLYDEERRYGRKSVEGVDATTMYLACMVHDVGESKYLDGDKKQEDVISEMLLSCGFTLEVAQRVAKIAKHVSFTLERSNTDTLRYRQLVEENPELAFVQDADRLEGIGAIGQGRCFVYGGANEDRRKHSIHVAVQLHLTRFRYYLEHMKTDAGRREAEKRWATMCRYRREWNMETDVSSVV